MERNKYLNKCKRLSEKSKAWWERSYDDSDLVIMDGTKYYPFAYRMDFMHGEKMDVAIMHDLNSDTEVYAPELRRQHDNNILRNSGW